MDDGTEQRMAHIQEAAQHFKKHQETIIKSLKDKDVSLRRRALDVLYSMCDSKNSELVVGQLLEYLEVCEFMRHFSSRHAALLASASLDVGKLFAEMRRQMPARALTAVCCLASTGYGRGHDS
jgi:hypothetical protein